MLPFYDFCVISRSPYTVYILLNFAQDLVMCVSVRSTPSCYLYFSSFHKIVANCSACYKIMIFVSLKVLIIVTLQIIVLRYIYKIILIPFLSYLEILKGMWTISSQMHGFVTIHQVLLIFDSKLGQLWRLTWIAMKICQKNLYSLMIITI